MIAFVSVVLTGGEVNMAALGWLCQEAGGGRGYWRMLICFVSMLWCVSIGIRGRWISAAVLGLQQWFDWTLILPLLTWCSGRCWNQIPLSRPPSLSCSLYVSPWPSQDWELTSIDRRLSPPAIQVNAVNALPRREDDSHLCMSVEPRLIRETSWWSCKIAGRQREIENRQMERSRAEAPPDTHIQVWHIDLLKDPYDW